MNVNGARLPVRPSVIALAFASLVTYVAVRAAVHPAMIDFKVYRIEGLCLRRGCDLYGNLHAPQNLRATYPPFAALVFLPFTFVPHLVGEVLMNVVNVALVAVTSWQSWRLVGTRTGSLLQPTIVLAALTLWAEPVYTTLGNGQVNLCLLALVLSDFVGAQNRRFQGIGIGIAAGLKATPLVFVVYLLCTRRFRAAGIATATFAATVGASALLAPGNTWHYWTKYLLDTARVGDLANSTNQSLTGLVARFAHHNEPDIWLSAGCAVTAASVLLVALFAGRHLGDSWGLPMCATAGLLGSPISWTHHWVWCVPITALLWRAGSRQATAVLVFWTFALFFLPHTAASVLRFPWWKIVMTNWYVVFGLVFTAIAAHAASRAANLARQVTPPQPALAAD